MCVSVYVSEISWHPLSDTYLPKLCHQGKIQCNFSLIDTFALSDTTFQREKMCHAGYVYCKFNAIFPIVKHVWAENVSLPEKLHWIFPYWHNFLRHVSLRVCHEISLTPLVTQLFSVKKCVTQGMSTVLVPTSYVRHNIYFILSW